MTTLASTAAPSRAALDAQLVQLTVTAFFLAVLFPFVTPVRTGTDTQPFAMLIALVITAASLNKRVPRELVLLFVPLIGSLFVLGLTGVTFTGIRSIASYLSIATIPYAFYLGMRWDRELFRRLLEFAVWAWLAAALLQLLLGRQILGPILPDVRTNAIRGVTGLASEPAHYGKQCVFFLMLVLMEFEGRKRNWLVVALLAQILLLAQSTSAGLFLFGMFGLYVLTQLDSPRRLALAALVGAGLIGALALIARLDLLGLDQSRLFAVASIVVRDPVYIFIADGSANNRLSNIVLSFYGFFASGMVPQGFGTFAMYVTETAPRFATIITHPAAKERIMSGYGAALFELGAIGMLIPGTITYLFWKRFRNEPRNLILYLTTFSVLVIAGTPLANPIIGVFAGYLAYTYQTRTNQTRTTHEQQA